MSKRSDLLRKIINISEECSDIESDATSFEQLSFEDEAAHIQSETSENEDNNEESVTEDENENIINIPRKRRRMRILSNSDEETENTSQEIEIAAYGTVWSKLKKGGISER